MTASDPKATFIVLVVNVRYQVEKWCTIATIAVDKTIRKQPGVDTMA